MQLRSFWIALLTLVLANGTAVLAQAGRALPVGSWRMHIPYSEGLTVCEMGGNVYVATPSGLFTIDPDEKSISVLNKVNGLSGVGITCMQKHPNKEILLIGYENGLVDIIEGNKISTLKDIFNASNITGSRRVNRIKIYNNEAYACCAFGLVVYNLDKAEVKESSLGMGTQGEVVNVRDCARLGDSLYAITNQGAKAIRIGQDIRDYTKWIFLSPQIAGIPDNISDPKQFVEVANNQLFIGTAAGFYRKGSGLSFSGIPVGYWPRSLRFFDNRFYVCNQNLDVLSYDNSFDYTQPQLLTGSVIKDPVEIQKLGSTLWVADRQLGLVALAGGSSTVYQPNSPISNYAFNLYNYKDQIIMSAGGYTWPSAGSQNSDSRGFSIFNNNEWTNYNNGLDGRIPYVRDLCHAMYNPFDKNLYFSSFGYGLLLKNGDTYKLEDDVTTQGGLCNILMSDCKFDADNPADVNTPREYVKLTSSAVDAFGGLWVSNFEVPGKASIRRRDPAGAWLAPITLQGASGEYPLEIVIDRNNYKWIRMAPNRNGGGLWVLNEDGSESMSLNTASNTGGLPSADVYDFKEDKQGYMWVGTAKGLAVFYNPFNVFYTGGVTASTPIYPPEAGRPVLENDVVTAIEIDGGNRKWVGTKENGVWLFNHDISKAIHHFTIENSPLPSNLIIDLCINKPTGELFISTDKGMVSYQTDATENIDENGNVQASECKGQDISIFPNPVIKNYSGLIAVKGLASNAQVRFVTPSGKLVYQTTAVGGMATWNGKTYDGKDAHPGIYIVLSSTIDGTANCVSKLAILD